MIQCARKAKKPFFSVIIPTFNRAAFLKISMESVFRQTFRNFELIIVDDGSTDNTANLVKELSSQDNRGDFTRYIYQNNQGVSSARNKGISLARGEFICFLDSDDRFLGEKLEITYNYIKKYPKYKIFHTEEIWYRNGDILPQKIYHKKPHGFVFKTAVKLCCISLSTAAIKKNVFDEFGLFDETLPACEDYDWLLRVTCKLPLYLIPEYLTVKEGGHDNQLSKKYPAMDKFRIYGLSKILEKGGLTKTDYKLALEELKNKCNIYITGAKKRSKIQEVNYYKQLIASFD